MEDSRRIWTRGGTTRSRERDRREVGTACLSERDRSSCFSKAIHVTSSFQIQTSLSYLNSNIFPLLHRGSHVHKVLHNSFLALQVRLGQVVACGASLYKTEPNWLLFMNLYPWIINQLLLLVIPLFISILPLKLDHRRSLGKLGTESTCLIKNLSVENLMG